jgi:DNA-directed RNA polymerase subunit alpha
VLHEFSSIPGVREDVTDIVLNIKAGREDAGRGPAAITLRAVGPGEVTAGMIETGRHRDHGPRAGDLHALDGGASISMELMVATGKGYVPASANRPEDAPIGLIPVDAVFSPVRKVSYKVENSRVGQVTDYDKLSMTVETNGTTMRPRTPWRSPRASCRTSCSSSSTSRSRAASAGKSSRTTCRSTATCCARSTSSSSRSARPTA